MLQAVLARIKMCTLPNGTSSHVFIFNQLKKRAFLCVLGALWAIASPGIAQDSIAPIRPTTTPSRQDALIEQAEVFLFQARATLGGAPFAVACRPARSPGERRAFRQLAVMRRTRVEEGLARVEAAERISRSARLSRLRISLLALWEKPGVGCEVTRRDAETLDAIASFRREYPTTPDVALDLEEAFAQSRVGNHTGAVEAYERALDAMQDVDEAGTFYANLAESLMLSGDLERAIEHFTRAHALASRELDTLAMRLALWGRGLAQARTGDDMAAAASIREALAGEATTATTLHAPGVSFTPAAEIFAYEALGQEAESAERVLDSPTLRRPRIAAWLGAMDHASTTEISSLLCTLGTALENDGAVLPTPPAARPTAARRASEVQRVRASALSVTALLWRLHRQQSGPDARFEDVSRRHELAAINALKSACRALR